MTSLWNVERLAWQNTKLDVIWYMEKVFIHCSCKYCSKWMSMLCQRYPNSRITNISSGFNKNIKYNYSPQPIHSAVFTRSWAMYFGTVLQKFGTGSFQSLKDLKIRYWDEFSTSSLKRNSAVCNVHLICLEEWHRQAIRSESKIVGMLLQYREKPN